MCTVLCLVFTGSQLIKVQNAGVKELPQEVKSDEELSLSTQHSWKKPVLYAEYYRPVLERGLRD